MIDWKIAGGFAAFSVVLSLLTGAIARNPFGVVLARSLVTAIVSAGLGVGVGYMWSKYLSGPAQSDQSPEDRQGESQDVDIVLPEENPHMSMGSDGVIEVDEDFSGAEGDQVENEVTEATEGAGEATVPDSKGLPDIGSMETSFSSGGSETEMSETRKSSGGDVVSVLGSDQDPSTVAKAIQSFMKKDQEG